MSAAGTLAWVIGRGGLLGSHVAAALAKGPLHLWHCPVVKFSWDNPTELSEQFDRAVAAFKSAVDWRQRWVIFWTAGRAIVGSSESDLEHETTAWQHFLGLVGQRLAPESGSELGTIFFASSAGGVYGANPHQPLTEESSPEPISAYGRTKLRQEEILRTWAMERPTVAYMIGRISNLYGPGQNLSKPQGLLSHISQCLIYHKPLHLYVPLDTIRDYIPVDACADHIVACASILCDRLPQVGEQRGYMKILASEQETSLGQIVATFARVSRRHPQLICSPRPLSAQHPNRLQFRSFVWRQFGQPNCISLQAGISRLHQHHLNLYLQGRLAPPS